MDRSGPTVDIDLDGIGESPTPLDAAYSLDESSCSTVVTDSVDSDYTPSPYLLGGLQFLKSRECSRQCVSESTHYAESGTGDDSQSTNCSESILGPSKRLKCLSIKETDTAHTSNEPFTYDVGNESPIILVLSYPPSDGQHPSPLPKIQQSDGREGQLNDKSSIMVTDNLMGIAEGDYASTSLDVLGPDLQLGQDGSHIRGNICRQIDGVGCGKNSGAGEVGTDDFPSHPCGSDIADDPVGDALYSKIDSNVQDLGRSNNSFEHQSAPSPEKMRKLSGESGFYLSDSLEEVTQFDGSACMFSDSSPVKSQSDHLLLEPQRLDMDTGVSEEEISTKEQRDDESKIAAIDHQIACESDDMLFNESPNVGVLQAENNRSGCQLQLQTANIKPSPSTDASRSSTAHLKYEAGTEDDLKCNALISSVEIEVIEIRNSQDVNDAVVASRHPDHTDRISVVDRVEAEEIQETSKTEPGPGDADRDVESSKRNTISEAMTTAKGQDMSGHTFSKRGKGRKRSSQTKNKRGKSSQIDRSQNEVMTRSQRQNAGIHRSDVLIHERVLVLQEKLTKVKSNQNQLTQSLSKPRKKIKDAAMVGQQLCSIQINLRQIASDLKEAKTDLERSLFDLRFVYSQKKRRTYVQQELKSVLEIQQTLWTQLKAHREIASRLQDIIRRHTEDMNKTRMKQTKHTTEKRMTKQESLGPTSSDGNSGNKSDNVAGFSESTIITEERQNALLQQLLETLDECEGNLLVKFMSMLQRRGIDQQTASLNLKRASSATSILGNLGENRRGEVIESGNLTSGLCDKDISADSRYMRKHNEKKGAEADEILRGGLDLLAESATRHKQDRSGSKSKLTTSLDASEKEIVTEDECSSGDSAGGEFLSSSDDEMSVVPEPSDKPQEPLSFGDPKTNGAEGKMKHVTSIGQMVPDMVQVHEDANDSFTNAPSSVSIVKRCSSTSAVELASLCSTQKTVQVSTSQFGNTVLSSGQKIASFHTPLKVPGNSTQRDNSSNEVARNQQVPSSHQSKSASPSLGGNENPKPVAKTQFKLITIPNTVSSGDVQILPSSLPQTPVPVVARLTAQTGQRMPGPVRMVSLKAVSLLQNTTRNVSATHENPLQCRQSLNSQVDIGISSPALGLHCKEKVRFQQVTAALRGSLDHPDEGSLSCNGRTRLEERNIDNCSALSGPSIQRDVPKKLPEQMPCIPDMKLYNKIRLINENELMSCTEVLPKEMWTTDDISMVELPREFFDEIDSW